VKIFVFGSNQAGRHGKGSALEAKQKYAAEYGVGEGRTGYAYAIPTKDAFLRPRALGNIELSVEKFIRYAKEHPELEFLVARIGCGLAGFVDAEIAPMFRDAPANCELPDGWRELCRLH
jgi:hypothetical protein